MTSARTEYKEAHRYARAYGNVGYLTAIAGRHVYPAHGYDLDRSPHHCGAPGWAALELNTAAHYRRAGCLSLARVRVEHVRNVRRYRIT